MVRVSPRGIFHVERMNQSAIAFFARALPEVSHEDWMRLDMATMFRDKAHFTPAQVAAALAPHREAVRTRAAVTITSEVCTASGERLARHMTPDGLLFAGHSEHFSFAREHFELEGRTVYRVSRAGDASVPHVPADKRRMS